MVENLASLGVTADEVDTEVGENGEGKEDDERHRDDCKADYLGPKNLSPLK